METYRNAFIEAGGNENVVIYAAIHRQQQRLVLQYWFFYYFNPWVNRHEGDWEKIQLEFPTTDVLAILSLDVQPDAVFYGHHRKGEELPWNSVSVGGHPVVYVANGSHANYGTAGTPFTGLGIDHSSDAGTALIPWNLVADAQKSSVYGTSVSAYGEPVLIRPGTHGWLSFPGRWGEDVALDPLQGQSGPHGPAHQSAWLDPLNWWR